MSGRAAFYDQSHLSYGSFSRTSSAVFCIKRKHKHNKILKLFLSKTSFYNLQKVLKKCSSKYNDYKSVINIAKNFGHVQNEILIYTLGQYNSQTKTVSFPDHEKLLKEVDSG